MELQNALETKRPGHANKSFRIVQLSDPHLSQIQIDNPLQLLNKRILGYLSWRKKRRRYHQHWVLDASLRQISQLRPDHIVITGDLAHIGLPREFDQIQNWVRQHFEPQTTTIIPGNHDLYVAERWDRSFAKLAPFMNSDPQVLNEHSYLTPFDYSLDDAYPIVRIRPPVALIGLSSVFTAPWGKATGLVNRSQLDRLEQLLGQASIRSLVKILLIHHPVVPGTLPERKSLLQADRLIKLLSDAEIDLVLHGHGHCVSQAHIKSLSGKQIPVIGCPSCSSTEANPARTAAFYAFDVHLENSNSRITQHTFALNMEKKCFEKTTTLSF